MIQRGEFFDLRVNFCLKRVGQRLQTPVLSCSNKRYIEEVRRYGGRPDCATKRIEWDLPSAKRYACYVLLHEIGHIAYSQVRPHDRLDAKGYAGEEQWCNHYSTKLLKAIQI